jgi:pimeloyl-ACP methyl ester carboxylesterase
VAEADPARRVQTRSGILEFKLVGAGAPAILLFNGAGETLESWDALLPDIAKLGTVLAWNRFGVQGSEDPRREMTGAVVLASLRELLGYAGLVPPYVLVAHSIGGLYANLFARLHPAETAAVLFIEAMAPGGTVPAPGQLGDIARALSKMHRQPEDAFRVNLQAEVASVPALAREIAAAGPFPDMPLTVIRGGTAASRQADAQALAELSCRSRLVVAGQSGHFPQVNEPHLVIGAVADLVTAVHAAGRALTTAS